MEGDRFGLATPQTLMLAGRQLIRSGEMVFAIEGPPFRLSPGGSWNVHGEEDPATWLYRLDTFGPDSTRTRWLPGAQVLHVRANCSPSRPYEGRSPFAVARLTSNTAMEAEKSAAAEAKLPASRVAPVATADATERAVYAKNLRKGGVVPVASATSPVGAGGQEPASRWTPAKLQPDPALGHVQVRREAMQDLLAAAGFPPALSDARVDGVARRESYRELLHGTIQPLARLFEAEYREKLDSPDFSLSFRRLAAGDTAGRTRSVKQLVEVGLSLDAALVMVGLVEEAM